MSATQVEGQQQQEGQQELQARARGQQQQETEPAEAMDSQAMEWQRQQVSSGLQVGCTMQGPVRMPMPTIAV